MITQIDIDLVLISRCSFALLWGILWAVFIQYNKLGQFIGEERTWIAVVVGVGVDLLIGIAALWWQLWLVIAFSSVGIIIRSLLNEKREANPAVNRYKVKWAMEAGVDNCGAIICLLEKALGTDSESKRVRFISEALSAAHKASREITFARYGEPEKK